MRRAIATGLLSCCGCATLLAQDTDPFFAGRVQMALDPSRVGFDPGAQVSFLHGDQWLQLPGSWSSDLLLGELCARNTKRSTAAWLGVGLLATRERQGAAESRTASVGFSPAMHVRAGRRSYLSAGLEAKWLNGNYGADGGQWGSQYDGMRYDAALPSGEASATGSANWIEARAGLSITVKRKSESARRRERNVLVAGISADHLGRLRLREGGALPQEAPIRFSGYVLGEVPYAPWDDGFFAAELIAHVQGPFRTGRLNIYAGKHLFNRVKEENGPTQLGFKAGLGYRYQDALLVNAAIDLRKATFGMAYGWSVFNKNTLAAGRRTFELLVQLRL